ncbi:cytochrome P450 family 706 subfamily A polypeptide 4 [Citrus sinensis]|uniref:Cytochrome P450 family 706 subfamily A polypeptide 4 n=1 Tax=Citrus sinensis TaxID=2711 RepID=A0ACB8MUP6_CITSI|nr:cytochrome P450 family 706 subfamily A polypeptide 4 [Citrus sinensis]KAH9789617.1 cytochrome P450 family 706 subfamily A polypeptide 4 [Citrus sinensis]
MALRVDDASSNETAIITCLVSVLAVVYFAWNVNKSRKANAKLPPGPRGLPAVGYLPFLGTTDLHKKFTELCGVYGPIFKLWLGNKLCVVVSSPSLVKQVVRDQDTTFADRDPPIAGLVATFGGNDIAWSNYGPEWSKLRKFFVGKMMKVKNTIRDLYNNDNKIGKPIDIGELSISTLVCVIQNILWGEALEIREEGITNLGAELKFKLAELMVLMGTPNISDVFPVLSWFDIQGIERKAKKISLWFENIINSTVEKYRSKDFIVEGKERAGKKFEGSRNKNFLQLLLELQENEDGSSSISMNKFKGVLVDIITGGTDTTTTMVEWTMAELMQHPQVMKKVQEELAQVVGMDSCVEEFHLPKLKYLDAVVKETFRLHPALPLLVPRRASESGSIGGYTIPKDTTLMLNVWAIHRDPQLWDNPLEFRPERFLNVGVESKFDYSGNNFQYLPFGSGRRMCAGIPLAERMLMFVLASLLHSFEWELPAGTKLNLSENFGIVIKKKEPLIAIPTPRLSNSELYH